MRPLRWRVAWVGGGLALVLLIVVLSLRPAGVPLPGVVHADKVAHALAYFALAAWFSGVFRLANYPAMALALVALGAGLELLQGSMAERYMDLLDALANTLGVLLGTVAGAVGLGAWCQWIEKSTAMSTVPADPARAPLAERMRPRTLSEVAGQAHLLAEGRPLHAMLSGGHLHSCVLWGPPGTGKTTLARLLADQAGARFVALSAVTAGVKDIRAAMDEARRASEATILFLDEVHRFNKSQQDAFLPYVEDGTVVFIGATTENPAFELNNALLSRARVYVLKSLDGEALEALLARALATPERGLGASTVNAAAGALGQIARYADGDARRALGVLEVAVQVALAQERDLDDQVLEVVLTEGTRRFDKGGDSFYDLTSALHKSVRGSDPDAALYWFTRLLDGGCDPRYLARRLIRIASEDIGNADPRALSMSIDAAAAFDRLGAPEGELALAQALVFMACAAKSNAVYKAFGAARQDVQRQGSTPVPNHLRNAPTRLAKAQGHGQGYRYDHDAPEGVAFEQTHFPEDMDPRSYYHPVPRGLEIRIGERLAELRARRGRKA